MDYDLTSSVAIVVAVVVGIFVVRWIVRAVFSSGGRDSSSGANEVKTCACGWEGNVSKFVNKCPNCGASV